MEKFNNVQLVLLAFLISTARVANYINRFIIIFIIQGWKSMKLWAELMFLFVFLHLISAFISCFNFLFFFFRSRTFLMLDSCQI